MVTRSGRHKIRPTYGVGQNDHVKPSDDKMSTGWSLAQLRPEPQRAPLSVPVGAAWRQGGGTGVSLEPCDTTNDKRQTTVEKRQPGSDSALSFAMHTHLVNTTDGWLLKLFDRPPFGYG